MSCAPLPRCPPMSASNRHRNRHQSGRLLPKQGNYSTNHDNLPDFMGNRASVPILSDINIGVCREKLTPKLTPDLTLIRRTKGSKKSGKISVNH